MIVEGEAVARFVSERIGFALCPPYTAMGIERDGEIIGGVIFNSFEGAAVHVTLAGKGWTRAFIKAVGDYVYRQLGCARITVTTADPKVVEYAQRLGGQLEGVLRDQFGEGRDATLVGILARDWRY